MSEVIKDDWTLLKGQIKTRFGKLTDESIDSMKGNMDLLSAKLQKVYGYAREQAHKEVTNFKASLHAATEPVKALVPEKVRSGHIAHKLS